MIKISRRNFIQNIGKLSFLFIGIPIEKRITHYFYEITQNKHINEVHSLSACFVTTGIQSGTLVEISNNFRNPSLVEMNDELKSEWNLDFQTFKSKNLCFSQKIRDRHLVFLFCKTMDQEFWLARELILKTNPDLLMTLVPSHQELTSKNIPSSNECWIPLSGGTSLQDTIKSMTDIYSSFALPGLVANDFGLLKEFTKGTIGKIISFENKYENHIRYFDSFVNRHQEIISKYKRLYWVLSYDHKSPPSMEDMTSDTDLMYSILSSDAAMDWSIDILRDIHPGFRATLLLTNPLANDIFPLI